MFVLPMLRYGPEPWVELDAYAVEALAEIIAGLPATTSE